MATLVANLFTDDIGINILSFLDHKTEIKYRIILVEDKLQLAKESGNGDVDELVDILECLYDYLNDPTAWITGDMVDEACDYDNTYPSESDYPDSDYSDYS